MDERLRLGVERAAQQVHRQATLEEILHSIVLSARETLPAFDHVGISVTTKHGVESPAATSPLVRELDALQYDLQEGSCWDTLQGHELVVAPTIRHDQRWPTYVPRAVGLGLRSQLAVRLYLDEQGTVGGINLYSTSSDEIPDDHVALTQYFAIYAATALGSARKVDSLTQATAYRQVIGQAIGILMERYTLDDQAARAFLWRASSTGNVKVRDLAQSLVDEVADRANRR